MRLLEEETIKYRNPNLLGRYSFTAETQAAAALRPLLDPDAPEDGQLLHLRGCGRGCLRLLLTLAPRTAYPLGFRLADRFRLRAAAGDVHGLVPGPGTRLPVTTCRSAFAVSADSSTPSVRPGADEPVVAGPAPGIMVNPAGTAWASNPSRPHPQCRASGPVHFLPSGSYTSRSP
ncbi:hypothetical protein ACWD25_05155 [Streptomyces sp. NPDC002920]